MSDRALLWTNLAITGTLLVVVVIGFVLVAPTVSAIKTTTDQVNSSGILNSGAAAADTVSKIGNLFTP